MKRSKFSLSHYKLLTMNMGELIPLTWVETIPGDSFQHVTSALVRVSPLLAPVMHPVRVRIHHFFVPNRLIWNKDGGADTDFEAFITGGSDGTATPTHPYINLNGAIAEGSLHDYLGIPPATYTNQQVSALPFRAYALIFNEYYRDQDLVTELTIDKTDGADTTTNTAIQKVAWEKDGLTTARPWETKGDSISIPFSGTVPVTGIGLDNQTYGSSPTVYETGASGTTGYTAARPTNLSGTFVEEDPNNSGYPGIYADVASSVGIDVNDLLLAFGLQNFQEARAKYGSRYTEYLRYLGIRPSDARLQLPEYLGGGRQVIQFSEVLSTDGANTGDMKGHGISAMRTNKYRRFFEEHGIVMTMMSVVPKAIYSQALDRKWCRTTKEEYFTKELQFIGDQVLTNKEVKSDHATPDGTFGYQPRYEEYRGVRSAISGEFHSTNDHWHMARIHASDPALNQTFTDCTPTTRIYASSSTDQLYIMANHSIQARRPISPVGKSKLIF